MIGKKFHELGVGHVICVDKEHELDDEAAVIFSNQFYGQLFSNQGSTICEAYHSAIHTLRDAKPSAEEKKVTEAEKFKLFTKHGSESCVLQSPDNFTLY